MNHIGKLNQQAVKNDNYRHVLATGPHLQVVITSIPAGGEADRQE